MEICPRCNKLSYGHKIQLYFSCLLQGKQLSISTLPIELAHKLKIKEFLIYLPSSICEKFRKISLEKLLEFNLSRLFYHQS